MNGFFDPLPRALAHRGNSGEYPENTEPAFRSALEIGADVIETDVHLMQDGGVVISHDDSFERLTGNIRKICELTVSDLESLDAGRNFTADGGKTFPFRNRGIRPLLLKEALALFPSARFNIDLKDPGRKLALAAATVIREAGAVNRICIGSFHHNALRTFRAALPEAVTSLSQKEVVLTLLFHRSGWSPASVRRGQAVAVQIPEFAGPWRILTPSLFRWCRKRSLHIQVWTVNEESRMKKLFNEGVEGIFSDDARLVVQTSRALFDSGTAEA